MTTITQKHCYMLATLHNCLAIFPSCHELWCVSQWHTTSSKQECIARCGILPPPPSPSPPPPPPPQREILNPSFGELFERYFTTPRLEYQFIMRYYYITAHSQTARKNSSYFVLLYTVWEFEWRHTRAINMNRLRLLIF